MVEWRKPTINKEEVGVEMAKSGIYRLSYRGIDFDFDSETRKIRRAGLAVSLTESRTMLLLKLVENEEHCVNRDVLCGEFWEGVDLKVARPRLSNLIHFTKKDLLSLHEDLEYSLGYVDESRKVRWNVVVG